MNQVTPPTPTEKSQIVVGYNVPIQALIMRFSTVKKGQKEYQALKKAWAKYVNRKNDAVSLMHDIGGDMFVSTIDLSCTSTISFVDHAKREKFIPV